MAYDVGSVWFDFIDRLTVTASQIMIVLAVSLPICSSILQLWDVDIADRHFPNLNIAKNWLGSQRRQFEILSQLNLIRTGITKPGCSDCATPDFIVSIFSVHL